MKKSLRVAVYLSLWMCILFPRDQPATQAPARLRQSSTMVDMTFPEFEAALKRTDVALVPIAAIEAHGPHLPLETDSIIATGQVIDAQRYLRTRGVETIVAPALNIGITTEASDWSRDGTYSYPGSLTVRLDTFVALYIDLLQSLRDQGLRRFFLYSGHYGPRHLKAVLRVAEEANLSLKDTKAYAIIHSESAERLGLKPLPAYALVIPNGRNFSLLTELLGSGKEPPTTAHADGAETSEMLYREPQSVRPGFRNLEVATSSQFFQAYRAGARSGNPSGMGGFGLSRASAAVGRAITAYRARVIGEIILSALPK